MSWRVGCCFLFFLIATAPSVRTAVGDQVPAVHDLVSLVFHEPKTMSELGGPPPFLARELVRQAFLIAARDEWGLGTRDATLREELPNGPSMRVVPFELFSEVKRVKPTFSVCYTLSRRKGTAAETLGEWSFQTDIFSPQMITDLADLAERMSRGKFKNLLHEQGLGTPVPAAREFAGVPRDAQQQLWEWNEIAVLGAVRRIHAEIHAKGESPELLAGLALGYGNLATLTANYYGPAHKAFAARALLYAERLLHETEKSDWALWHRAYVRAIIGLHNQALADVKAAKKLWDKKSSKPLPFWTEVLDAFCRGQLPQMLEKAKTRDQRRLARYLNLEAVGYSGSTIVTYKVGHALLEECPDCLAAADSLCSLLEIGPMNEVTSTAFPLFSKTLRTRLPDVYGFPAALAKRLTETKPPGDAESGVDDEVDFRVQLVSDIKSEAASGRDTAEPSLAVLGQMIEEIEFMQVMRRLQLEGYIWAVPTEQTVAAYRPLCAHHPYAAFLDAYAREKSETDKAAQSLQRTIQPSELGLVEGWILNWLRLRSAEPGTLWLKLAWCHTDPVFRDEMIGLGQGIAATPDEKTYNRPHMEMMWHTSSMLPAALAIQVDRNWKRAKFFSATVEKDYADDPILMASLARRYLKTKQLDDAERCAKQKVRAAPDYPSYETLAEIYKAKGDMVRWQESLENSLDLPAVGLEQARIRDEIARYHLERKEWKEAARYADAAAESYSEWSMMTAARCHEMLGEWEKCEALMRAISERYAGSSMEWMLWCYRTGHGDASAADHCARAHFESLGTSFYWQTRERIGIYYLLRNEPEKAIVVFKQTFEQGHNAYDAMHAAMIADALAKTAERDQLLSDIIHANADQNPKGKVNAGLYKQLAELMRKSLPPGSPKDFAYDNVDPIISKSPNDESPTNFEYFVGMFLKNRGEVQKSNQYLIRSAQSSSYKKYNHILALRLLRELKVSIPSAVAENAKAKK